MPRDLASSLSKKDTVDSMPQLDRENAPDALPPPQITKSPDEATPYDDEDGDQSSSGGGGLFDQIANQRNEKRDVLHPYTQTLTLNDVESCVRLEEATFPAHERCSREKFQYRLKTCGELSLGIFTSIEPDPSTSRPHTPTVETSAPVYSGAPERKAVLLGHIVATKTTNPTVTDNDMHIPSSDSQTQEGHQEAGRTICVHSLAVLPEYQRRGLGKTLMKAYLQRMESHGVADRVALIAHEELISYYEEFGFGSLGKSEVGFGGGGWFDMVRELGGEKGVLGGEVDMIG